MYRTRVRMVQAPASRSVVRCQSSVGVRAARVGREWFWVVMSGLDVSEGDVSWCVGSVIRSRSGFVVGVSERPRHARGSPWEGSRREVISPSAPRRRAASRPAPQTQVTQLTQVQTLVRIPVETSVGMLGVRGRRRSSGVGGSTSCVRCSRPGGSGAPGGGRPSTPTTPGCDPARRSPPLRGSVRSGGSRPVPAGRSPRGSTTSPMTSPGRTPAPVLTATAGAPMAAGRSFASPTDPDLPDPSFPPIPARSRP